MGTLRNAGLDEIYDYIMRTASLDEVGVATKPPSMGPLSFVELDGATRQNIMPDINEMNDISREKARFMLDICMLNLLRKGRSFDPSKTICVDVHFSTLVKTAFRTRYLIVLAEFLKHSKFELLLNIKCIRDKLHTTRISDLLRYLIPLRVDAALQISQDNILSQDLTKIAVNNFVLTVGDLTAINDSKCRQMTMERLARLPKFNKHIIVRNAVKEPAMEPEEEAFYL